MVFASAARLNGAADAKGATRPMERRDACVENFILD